MADARVKVTVTTDVLIKLFINMDEVVLDANKEGQATVTIGEKSLMVWMAAGDPGAPYEIKLDTVAQNLQVEALTGSNPVKSRISTLLFTASGHIRFLVKPK